MFLVFAVLGSRWAQPGGDSIVEQYRIESSEGQEWSCRSPKWSVPSDIGMPEECTGNSICLLFSLLFIVMVRYFCRMSLNLGLSAIFS